MEFKTPEKVLVLIGSENTMLIVASDMSIWYDTSLGGNVSGVNTPDIEEAAAINSFL